MDTFDGSCFEGNSDLCGQQVNKTCPGDMPPVEPQEPTTHDDGDDNSGFYEALHMSLGFGFFTGFWGLLGPLLIWKSWRIAYIRFLNKMADYIYVTVAVYAAKFYNPKLMFEERIVFFYAEVVNTEVEGWLIKLHFVADAVVTSNNAWRVMASLFISPWRSEVLTQREACTSHFQTWHNGPWDMLSTWKDDDDCCKWKGITCSNQTGHVLRLHLPGSDSIYLLGQANISTLIGLQHLEHLDLSYNVFMGSYISEHIGLFNKLTYLNLSEAEFGGSIPYQLGKLTHLHYLDLTYNYLYGVIPYQLKHLGQLQYLGLQRLDEVSGAIPFESGDLPLLHTLKLCADFVLQTKDVEWVSNLSFLKNLDLSLSVGNSHQWLQTIRKHIPNLTELRLSDCNLSDNDVQFLFDIHSNNSSTSSLTILDFSYNMLTSSTFQLLSNFSAHLRELYLLDNNIVLSHPHYPKFPSLVILDLSYNNLTSSVFQGNFNFGSNLEHLDLSNCSLMDTSFPMSSTSTVNSSSSLVVLRLSYNLLTSSNIFHWIFNFTANLHTLYLRGNLLEGRVPNNFDKTMNSLEHLDLSFNKLQGEIPTFYGNICTLQTLKGTFQDSFKIHHGATDTGVIPNLPLTLPHGALIDLSSNQFEGVIPSVLLHASSLILSENKFSNISLLLCQDNNVGNNLGTLVLANNQLEGSLPDCWESVSSLLFLDLNNNYLTGKIPPSMGSLVKLEALVLRSNRFIGKLPSNLKNCTNLFLLDVSENLLSGPIPSWIGESLQSLIVLSMAGNSFSGNLSIHLCYLKKIQLLDLSRNKLSNEIPTLMWKGVKSGFKNPELLLNSIDLSSNHFTGEIPKEIVYLVGLVSLNLSRNNLSGEIPDEIGNIISLESLDLSRNHISGTIPSSLSQIDNLVKLELSSNSFHGRIPPGRHMDTFDGSCFEENPYLCGPQLNKTCPGDMPPVKPEDDDDEDDNSEFYEALHMSLGFGFFTGFWGLLGPLLFWRSWRIAYLRFLNKVADYIYVTVAVYAAKCYK
ncbi:hypothetical protein PIB30_089229 [Stylosanthes scabra]|uniref:Leucine-rich repeat-containing N-terminal plant-type domain-containing protein n=1 Tax=Stylosanthes scabra TaxID=79078 RepID=A0ABU6XTB5_9FABA|nr:hypothetical protein [Stylosanthes scabra]